MLTSDKSRTLHLTERGSQWLNNFQAGDRSLARYLLDSLTLISHSEFERALETLIDSIAAKVGGPIALYAAREIPPAESRTYFDFAAGSTGELNAVAAGSGLGSEARIAAFIRNRAQAHPKTILNHPNVTDLRSKQAKAILVVDDLIGSGKRTSDFVGAIWRDRTIRSWWSRKDIQLFAVAYAATAAGAMLVSRQPSSPTIEFVRDCPTLDSLAISEADGAALRSLLTRYASDLAQKNKPLGFKKIGSLLVFEHGCPNNAPAVFWSRPKSGKVWEPLFPGRAVLTAEKSAFPLEVQRQDAVLLLHSAGQARTAAAWNSRGASPLGESEGLTLALLAKGYRGVDAIAYATSLEKEACKLLLERCIDWGLVTTKLRLTDRGRKELQAFEKTTGTRSGDAALGSDVYYPNSLRAHVGI